MARHKMPDVVVLLPGITGSVLKKDGKVVWGFSAATIGKALFTLGGSMRRALALPHDDPAVDDLGDGVTAAALMPDLHLLPGIWKIDGYTKIAEALQANFDVTEGQEFLSLSVRLAAGQPGGGPAVGPGGATAGSAPGASPAATPTLN